MDTLELARLMSFSVVSVASAVLLYFLLVYVKFLLADVYRHGWWLIGTAMGAGIIYGVSGAIRIYRDSLLAGSFEKGASLFFILFLALGIRSIARLESGEELNRPSFFVTYGFDLLVVGLFIVAWWVSFTLWRPTWLIVVEGFGWAAMLLFALFFGIRAVRRHEGTSIASVIRHLLPAVIGFGAVVLTELFHRLTGSGSSLAEAAWIVGMVLVGAFLFNTATTLRQEEAELHRMYDRTTWKEETG